MDQFQGTERLSAERNILVQAGLWLLCIFTAVCITVILVLYYTNILRQCPVILQVKL